MAHEQKELTIAEKIWQIVERFYDPVYVGTLSSASAPFDITKPNIHDSKREFLLEKEAVEKVLAASEVMMDFILSSVGDEESEQKTMSQRVIRRMDKGARVQAFNDSAQIAKTVGEHLRRSVAIHGLTFGMTFNIYDFRTQLQALYEILLEQEKNYWSAGHRAPNHYARTIALRFAKLLASKTGERPTFGMSRDGNHPSTDFGRALEEIFELLEINADVKRAAQWALGELKREDYYPPVNPFAALMTESEKPNKRDSIESLLLRPKGL